MFLKKTALAPATAWPKHRLELAQLVSFKKSTRCLKFGWVFEFAMNWIGDWNSPSCWRLVTYCTLKHVIFLPCSLSRPFSKFKHWNYRCLYMEQTHLVKRTLGNEAPRRGKLKRLILLLHGGVGMNGRQRWSMNEALLRKERPQKRTQQIRRTTTIIAWKSQGYASDMVNKLQYLMHIRHTTKFKDRTASPLKCSTTLHCSRSCRYHHRHINLRRNKMKQACLEWYKHPKNHEDEYLDK